MKIDSFQIQKLYKIKNLNDIKIHVNALLKHNPTNAYVNSYLGEYYGKQKNFSKAKTYQEKAILSNPYDVTFYVNLANTYKYLSNFSSCKLFLEYALLIDDKNGIVEKIFLRANISGKKINKNLLIKNNFKEKEKNYREIIQRTRNEIIDLVKSQNLIDIKTPSFLNIKLTPNKNNNLAELHKRLNNIGLVDNLYVLEINSEYVLLKIKYLGKLEKIINELKKEKIILKQKNDEWSIKLIK